MKMNNNSRATIIGINSNKEAVCAASARISTQLGTADEIFGKSLDNAKNASLITKVLKSGHSSVIEHTFLNISFNDVSVAVEQFMIEFRLGSYTVKSRRYVDFSKSGYYTPELPSGAAWTDSYKEAFSSHMDKLFETYETLISQDIPKEDARFILPYCYKSNFYCSMNAREFLHVLKAMLYGRGSVFEEIHRLGLSLLEQAKKMCPAIFEEIDLNVKMNDEPVFDLPSLSHVSANENAPLVELLDFTNDAGRQAAKIALISDLQISTQQADELLKSEDILENVLQRLIQSDRPRALENIAYTFRINRLSLPGVTHIVRHRMQNISIPSLKKVNIKQYVTPESICAKPELLRLYNDTFDENINLYTHLKENGVPAEYLVYFALSGNTLDLITTMNARELLLFLRLRTCNRAQWEIRGYAIEMLRILREVSPELFKYYGASCYLDGHCPEGKLTCGKIKEMQAFFSGDMKK